MSTLHFDGTGGKGGGVPAAAFILRKGVQRIARSMPLPPNATSNEAEFRGLIEGLREAKKEGMTKLHVVGDSQLIIRFMDGSYKVKEPRLQTLHREAKELSQGISIRWEWVGRELNKEADRLCGEASLGNYWRSTDDKKDVAFS